MEELELERAPGDRRLYLLDGIGSARFEGLLSRGATAESNGERWRLRRRGFWGRQSEALDEAGSMVGRFEPRTIRRGGAIVWHSRDLTLRPASAWRERYALAEGETELALLDGKGWGRRPVAVSVNDSAALEGGLLLFAAFVVRGLAEDASSVAGASASTAATGGRIASPHRHPSQPPARPRGRFAVVDVVNRTRTLRDDTRDPAHRTMNEQACAHTLDQSHQLFLRS